MPAKVCERSILPGESIVPRTIRNCILFGYTGEVSGIDAVGKIAEKIMAEDAGDARAGGCRYSLFGISCKHWGVCSIVG